MHDCHRKVILNGNKREKTKMSLILYTTTKYLHASWSPHVLWINEMWKKNQNHTPTSHYIFHICLDPHISQTKSRMLEKEKETTICIYVR